jgi:hypothetical protein
MNIARLSLVGAWALWRVLSVQSSVCAQTSPVPYDQPGGPLFSLTPSSYVYGRHYRSFHDIDFKNLTVVFPNYENGKWRFFHLRNGECKVDYIHHLVHTSVEVAGIHYLTSAVTEREYALVLYEEADAAGSSNEEGIAQLFELARRRLRVAQQIDWDLHYGGPFGPLDTFNEATNTLSIHSSHYLPGDGHCCVSAVDVVTYRWDGRHFYQTALRTELTDYGRKEGKKLGPLNK